MDFLKNIRKAVMLSVWVLGMSACTSDFDAMNTDPNNPTRTTAELLLTPLLRSIVQNQFNYNNGSGLAHHLARTNYNEIEQYAFGTNEGTWTFYYLQLNNIEEMIKVSERDGRPSCKAIAYILKAFAASQLTDLWGDVPFYEATQGAGNISPKYDLQESVYTSQGGILHLLEEADRLLEESKDVIPADLIYGGDRLQWRKLANSLRLRYLVRISNRIGQTDYDIMKQIAIVVEKPLMECNEDNMLLPFLAGSPNKCPIYDMRSGEFEYVRMSKEMARIWGIYQDPRISVWFAPTTNSQTMSEPEYCGVPVGCSSTTLTSIGYSQADVSMLGDRYRKSPDGCDAVLMNCSEVKFLLAEVYAKGYVQGNVRQVYEDGIRLSMEYYGIPATTVAAYLDQSAVMLDIANPMEQIMTQKWLSLFMVGYESWFDFLRTGLPEQDELLDNRNPTAAGEVPSRFYYPEDEQVLNTKNYEEAVERQGGEDNINSKLWWEK